MIGRVGLVRKGLTGLAVVAALLAAGASGNASAADPPAWRTIKVIEGKNGNRSALAVDSSSVRLDGGIGHATVAMVLNLPDEEGARAGYGMAMTVDYDCARRAARVTGVSPITDGPLDFRDIAAEAGVEASWDVPPAGTPMDAVGLMACAKQPLPAGPSYASPQALRAAWMKSGG